MRLVNLLPEENQKKEQWRMVRLSFGMTFLPLALGLILIHALLGLQLSAVEQALRQPKRQGESAQIAKLRQEISAVKAKGQKLVTTDKELIKYFVVQPASSRILKNIAQVADEKVWLTEFVLDSAKETCDIGGKSFNIRLVSEFMLGLKKLLYFEDVALVTMEEGAKDKDGEVTFKVTCRLKGRQK